MNEIGVGLQHLLGKNGGLMIGTRDLPRMIRGKLSRISVSVADLC